MSTLYSQSRLLRSSSISLHRNDIHGKIQAMRNASNMGCPHIDYSDHVLLAPISALIIHARSITKYANNLVPFRAVSGYEPINVKKCVWTSDMMLCVKVGAYICKFVMSVVPVFLLHCRDQGTHNVRYAIPRICVIHYKYFTTSLLIIGPIVYLSSVRSVRFCSAYFCLWYTEKDIG